MAAQSDPKWFIVRRKEVTTCSGKEESCQKNCTALASGLGPELGRGRRAQRLRLIRPRRAVLQIVSSNTFSGSHASRHNELVVRNSALIMPRGQDSARIFVGRVPDPRSQASRFQSSIVCLAA